MNTHYVLLPIPTLIAQARTVNTAGRKWNRLVTSIEQPEFAPDTGDGALKARDDIGTQPELAVAK